MTPKHTVKSVCPYCGVGCGIVMEVAENRIVKVSGDKTHPTNFGRLCTKGATCGQAVTAGGRADRAYLRMADGRDQGPVAIEVAIGKTADGLRRILAAHGPDALSFYVSGQMSLEAQYLANKLAKGFIGTNNIESNSRLCMASAASGYKLSLGADGPPGSYQDFDRADLFFVTGANMADCHPILFLRMMDRVKAGAKLIVVDPRRSATADKADLFLQIRPGTDLALLNGLLHLLMKSGHLDQDFIAAHTEGWEAMPDFLEAYSPARVAALTGLAEADIRQAAAWIGAAPEWMSCWTMGLNQSTHGTWNTNAICNLHLATGKICRPGSGPFSLTGQPNAMGGREMGYMGSGLPGQRSTVSADDRAFVEDLWQVPRGTLRAETGGGTVAMFEDMAAGKIKACWIICTNPVASVPNRKTVIAALEAAELVIAQDAFLDTETNVYADIILPGALWAEAEGVMINSERNMTLMQQAVAPPGEAMADWQLIARVACEMGYAAAFSYTSAAEIFDEIRQAWNPRTGYDIRGASHDRLRETPLQWPCAPDAAGDRHPIRYLNDGVSQTARIEDDGTRPVLAFPTPRGRAFFFPRPHLLPAEMPDAEFPLILNTGRLQHQWHTLTKTGKIPTLNKLNPGPFVELHPEDAAGLGISGEDRVEIRSRRGKAILPAIVTDRVRPGCCFAPFHWNDVFGEDLAINAVTNDAVDPLSLQPEFKFCAVALTRVSGPVPVAMNPPEVAARPTPAPQAMPADLPPSAPVEAFAHLMGLGDFAAPALDPLDQIYLQGFLSGLRSAESRRTEGVPVLPTAAPFDAAKQLYINGLLAGLFSRTAVPMGTLPAPSLPPVARMAVPEILILWASQTGNAEDIAARCARRLIAEEHAIRLVSMENATIADLAVSECALLVASTFGDGDPPDNGAAFWKALAGAASPLSGLRFTVLALGDSSYDQFCGFGRKLDGRLADLGAKRLLDRTDCEPDSAEIATTWLDRVVAALTPTDQAAGEDDGLPGGVSSLALADQTYLIASPGPARGRPGSTRQQPFHAKLRFNRLLNTPGAAKETRHYSFDVSGAGLDYSAGDALGVWPTQCARLVDELLGLFGLAASTVVAVKDKGDMALGTALTQHFEITRITRDFLGFIHRRRRDLSFAPLLDEARKAELAAWTWGRQIVDVAREAAIGLGAEELLSVLKPLQPRLYSISSSLKVQVGEVQLTVSTVRYDRDGRRREGACSAFLADRAAEAGAPIFLQRSSHFRLPADPDQPIIMVGPGTGIAPFRAFLHERRALGAGGANWLFFGEQHAASDFYYRDEIAGWRRDGHLARLDLAFSRDQAEKIYVQHRMIEQGAVLWRWLDSGAHFYVCGDAGRMAKDVDAALRTIIQCHGGLTASDADAYVERMAQEKRYLRDVY